MWLSPIHNMHTWYSSQSIQAGSNLGNHTRANYPVFYELLRFSLTQY